MALPRLDTVNRLSVGPGWSSTGLPGGCLVGPAALALLHPRLGALQWTEKIRGARDSQNISLSYFVTSQVALLLVRE